MYERACIHLTLFPFSCLPIEKWMPVFRWGSRVEKMLALNFSSFYLSRRQLFEKVSLFVVRLLLCIFQFQTL